MAKLKITPGAIQGTLQLPPSKSHTMRALIFGAMGDGVTKISHPLDSPDTHAMVAALRAFGISIEWKEDCITIVGGKLQPCQNIIDAGNSGQVLRFVGSLAALLPSYTILTGDHSIRHSRPVQPLLSALNQLQGFAVSTNGHAPIIVRGPIKSGHATLTGEDSQPVSGLLITTSFLEGKTTLDVTNPGEKPWVDMTLSWLKRLGGHVEHENHEHYEIAGGLFYKGFEYPVTGDFSSAAFPLVAAIITGSPLTLENVDKDDVQGDKRIVDVLQQMGAKLEWQKNTLKVMPGGTLHGMRIDANEMIDAIPILAVLGCFTKTPLEIVGGAIARKKESDRLHTIASELRKMGAIIEEKDDGLVITPSQLKGAPVFSHHDHRIAMALGVAALGAKGETSIEGVECIAKSYPTFICDFQKVGACLQ